MDFILKTTNLCKSFGKHSAVTDVSIHVRENSVYGLLGPNVPRYEQKTLSIT